MKKILGFVIVGCLVACGGASPDDSFRSTSSGDDSGEGGEDGEAGGDSSSSVGGEDGVGGQGSTSSGTTASGQCQPSVTCASVGAECGTIADDGCGNPIDCPNNCTGFNVCGGAGDQFKCGCTPKTCNDIGAECGFADDGCGGELNCGGCGNEPYVSCGGPVIPNGIPEELAEGPANQCNGGCQWLNNSDGNAVCSTAFGNEYRHMWRCADETPWPQNGTPPRPDCHSYYDEAIIGSSHPGYSGTWCCTTFE